MRKFYVVAGALSLMIAPAALAKTTLENVVEHGVILTTGGYEIAVTYKDDGSYASKVSGYDIAGSWRVDGKKLCTSSTVAPTESCTEYPDGKNPGDSFEVQSPTLGAVTVKINE